MLGDSRCTGGATYTVSNWAGGRPSDVLAIAVGDDQFAIADDTCSGVSLASLASCTFTVTFTPTKVGMSAAVLYVADAASGSPQATLQIAGTATTTTSD